MSILQEILNWAKGLPPWQSDAVSRLFSKGALTSDDMDDLYALLKSEHGIPDPKGRKANPLADDKIPAGSQSNSHVELLAIKNLLNVNAIAENKRLQFGPKGLTVIYGDNGSGKSGYSRVLKKACRARDQNEPILPNANKSSGNVGPASAVFEIRINNVPKELLWENTKSVPQELSSLAIFDSRCARAYLDDEDDFSYVPYGLDILEGLAGVCKQFDARIKKEQSQCLVDKTPFNELAITQTAVGKLLTNLNAKTPVTDIEKLAALNADESNRRDELEKNLKADNPKEKASQLRLKSARIAKLANNATEKFQFINEAALRKLKGLAEAYHIAKAAAELAANNFKKDATLLPGTGGEAWKELFEAARKFSQEAYQDKKFPKFDNDTLCPLCQQPLNNGANRLLHFEEFIQQEAEKKFRTAKKSLTDQYKLFENQSLALGFDDLLFKEIESIDVEVAKAVRGFEKTLSERHKSILQACADRAWDKIIAEPANPTPQLQVLANNLIKQAEELEKMADEKARVELQREFNELDSRLKLNKLKSTVITAIERYAMSDKLAKCLSATKTNSITLKSTELTDKVVSKELADALNQEYKMLGAGNLRVSLATRSAKGKALHKLRLGLPQAKGLSDILSEGEQRAVAIGSFLAEVNIGKGTGGIIFDDPVSSLDHKRRERVAVRLVQEANKRQVIILTHDVYFLWILMDEADRTGVPITTQSLSKRPEGFGVADPTLPFESMSTKARVGALRDTQQRIAKLHKNGDDPEFRKQTVDCYRQLRIAWERAVEEVLFRSVVLRFRKGISTQLLSGVVVEDDDYTLIDQAMTKCSNYAHDQAAMGGVSIPEPDELLVDITSLDNWRISVEKRASDVTKRRK